MYPDGTQVKAAKAVSQLQDYVFDAWMRMAEIFEALGEKISAAELRSKAAKLRDRFEENFWCEDLGFYALALDGDKQPVRTIASNPGHCLWIGAFAPSARKIPHLILFPIISARYGPTTTVSLPWDLSDTALGKKRSASLAILWKKPVTSRATVSRKCMRVAIADGERFRFHCGYRNQFLSHGGWGDLRQSLFLKTGTISYYAVIGANAVG